MQTGFLVCLLLISGLILGAGRQVLAEGQPELLAGRLPQREPAHRRQLMQNIQHDMANLLRQASVADARSRIRSAVDAGGEREMVAGASQSGRNVPLRRAMLQSGSSSLTDALRAVQQQDRSAASSAMIRRAVTGEMDVGEAISGAQTTSRAGNLVSTVSAERAAGRATAQGRALP